MKTAATSFIPSDLQAAIVRNPLIISPDATIREVIALMSQIHIRGRSPQPLDRSLDELHLEARSSCVLVVENEQLLGILTERDIVRLSDRQPCLDNLRVREEMASPVVSLRASDFTDILSAANLLQQQIYPIPLLDDQDRVVGLLTHKSLWQLLRLPKDYTTELERQVEQRVKQQTAEIKAKAKRDQQNAADQQAQAELTKRQRIEATLRKSEQRYATLTEMAPVGIFQTDVEGNCLYVNERWCQISGLTPAEAAGFGWVNGIHPDDREFISTEWYAAAQANQPFRLEYRFQNATGQITWVFAQAAAERRVTGEIVGYVGTITDISDRKATEQALKIQRDFNQLIAEITSRFVDLSPDALDAEIERTLQLIGKITQVDTSYLVKINQAAQTLSMTHEWCKPQYPRQIALVQDVPLTVFPYSTALLLNREIHYVSCIADLPAAAAVDQASFQQFNLTAVLSIPLIQKSVVIGFMGFASFSQAMTWDEETIRLLRIMSQTMTNAQERIQDEQRLSMSEERLRLALRATNQGLYDLNVQTGEVIVTPEYATMLGYNPAIFQETNAKWVERLHPDDRESVANIYQAYVAGTLPEYKVEFRQRTQAGEWKWILSLGKIVGWDATGQPLRMLGTHMDISDRKQAEAERLQAEQVRDELKLLENILDVILAGYWDWDIPNNQEYLSPGFKRMFGYEDDELPNSPESWQRLIFSEDLPSVLDCFDRHVRSYGAVPYRNEVRYRHKDGSTVWVICSGQVIDWDIAGKPLRMIGCHIDITERKQAEAALRESEEFKRRMLESSNDCIKLINLDGQLQYMNAGGQCIMEIDDFSRCLNVDWDSFWPEASRSELEAAIISAKAGQIGRFQGFCPTAKGTPKWWDVLVTPILDEAGQVAQLLAVSRDISARKQAEEQLRKSDAHLKTAQRIAKLGSWAFDLQTNQITWSDEVFRIFGRDPAVETPSFGELQQLFYPDDRDHHQQVMQTAIDTAQAYEHEYRLYQPDGTLKYIQSRGEPIVDTTGQLIQLVGTVLDITDRKQAEATILQTTAQLEASNRELEAFAYSVSHDLRSPLRAIDGFSKALLEDYGDQFNEEGKDYFDRIHHNVNRMGMLIDDLLRLSRVSRSEIRHSSVDLSTLVQEQMDELQALEPERQVTWVVVPRAIVLADATLMRVVISNLLQNAWKFTSHHATARIEFGVMPLEAHPTYFVRDDGAGFDMVYANMLFGVFQRLHNTHEFPGTGIGLATVQRAIHRHAGRVWAEGAVEQGATIYFTVPQTPIQPGA